MVAYCRVSAQLAAKQKDDLREQYLERACAPTFEHGTEDSEQPEEQADDATHTRVPPDTLVGPVDTEESAADGGAEGSGDNSADVPAKREMPAAAETGSEEATIIMDGGLHGDVFAGD